MTKDWTDYCSTTNEQCYLKEEDYNWSDEFYDCPQYFEYYQEWCS